MLNDIKFEDLILGKKIGKGQFGAVFESKIKGDDTIYATKLLNKAKYNRNPDDKKYIENEIKLLKNMNHENIIKLYNSDLEDSEYRYLITEYCNGGDLGKILDYYMKKKNRPFNEEEVQHIMRQLLNGINYLHSKTETKDRILHRDLKLENILLHYNNEDDRINKRILKAKIKIADFGFSRYLQGPIAQTVVGSPLFMDPRILSQYNNPLGKEKNFGYEQKADIYSLGIIFYNLLTGDIPFEAYDLNDLKDLTKVGIYRISEDFSKETISFLNFMLRYDPTKRLDVEQLLKHKFITKDVKDFTKIDKSKLSKENVEGNQLVFNLKDSKIDYIDGSMFEEKEEKSDKVQEELNDKINNINILDNQIKNEEEKKENKEPTVNGDLDKLILESFNKMNRDAVLIDHKLVPFIPGVDPNILLKKY